MTLNDIYRLFKMIFIEFDRYLKTFIDFYRVCKCMDDIHRLLFLKTFIDIEIIL